MQRTVIFAASLLSFGLAGCASGLPQGQQTSYSDLPGARDMAKGPGLLSGDHYDKSNGGGTLLYSDAHPGKSVFGSVHSRSERAKAAPSQDAVGSATAHGASAGSKQDFRDFRNFQAYKHFQQLPADSPEKQRFHNWQEWQEYKQWQNQQ